ncbi:tonB-system energizer ExbB [Bosea sp. 117]|uniref:tonB-system energizer ExbB n=1 Tax=Bosea sp. 117 TaxID=1125973 RepID=UPI0004941215|nr:tonB-system energizer ExbB [Bosea sp. 117]
MSLRRFASHPARLLAALAVFAALVPAPLAAQESVAPAPAQPVSPQQVQAAPAQGVNPSPGAPGAELQQAHPVEMPSSPVDSGVAPSPVPASAEAPVANAELPHDLSPWGMFMAADWVVKAVMIGLAFASVVTWTVWLAKTLELFFTVRRLRGALRSLLGSTTLDDARRALARAGGPAAAMLRVTDLELERSGPLPAEGIKERVAISLGRIEAGAGRRITRGTGLLATIGATAPFVGLFGTVWGIMNSFIGISKAQTTNLAVVAPGIAEALLATAIGLVAAIPAVVIYNHFTRQVSGYRALLGDASAETLRLLSRDLDRRDAAPARQEIPYAPPVRVRAAAE